MALRQIGNSGRKRPEQMCHAIGRLSAGRRGLVKEGFERHADHIRRPTVETTRCLPKRATERSGQADRDLILQDAPPFLHCNCSATHCVRQGD